MPQPPLPTLTTCQNAFLRMGWTGVYRLCLYADGTIIVARDGVAKGNGTEVASIRCVASDFEELKKRQAAREIRRRFAVALEEKETP